MVQFLSLDFRLTDPQYANGQDWSHGGLWYAFFKSTFFALLIPFKTAPLPLREDQREPICKHQSANCRRSLWGVARIHCALMQFHLLSDLQLCLSCSGFIYNHTHLSVTLHYVYIIYIYIIYTCSPSAYQQNCMCKFYKSTNYVN